MNEDLAKYIESKGIARKKVDGIKIPCFLIKHKEKLEPCYVNFAPSGKTTEVHLYNSFRFFKTGSRPKLVEFLRRKID